MKNVELKVTLVLSFCNHVHSKFTYFKVFFHLADMVMTSNQMSEVAGKKPHSIKYVAIDIS